MLGLILGASLLCQFSAVRAEQIKYVFDGTASGTLGSQSFSSVDLSATTVTDTALAAEANGDFGNPTIPFTIDIGGIGPTTLPNGVLGDHSDFAYFGWLTTETSAVVIEIHNPAFLGHNITTSIGPITETGADPYIGNWSNTPTSGGDLTVTSWNDVSFTATLGGGASAVPLPNAAWLSLIGLPFVVMAARRGVNAPRKA
jgi:hypothetical protein